MLSVFREGLEGGLDGGGWEMTPVAVGGKSGTGRLGSCWLAATRRTCKVLYNTYQFCYLTKHVTITSQAAPPEEQLVTISLGNSKSSRG